MASQSSKASSVNAKHKEKERSKKQSAMVFAKEGEAGCSSYSLTAYPREDTPFLGKSPPLSSNLKTFANIFISIVGAGVLGLPYSFKRTGWLMGLLMLFAVAFLTYHCMMLLVLTRRKLDSLSPKPKPYRTSAYPSPQFPKAKPFQFLRKHTPPHLCRRKTPTNPRILSNRACS